MDMQDDDPEEWILLVNECLAEDDADDTWLESYQHYGTQP
jgi:hypothetical protein